MKEQLQYVQELNKQKELLYAVELEKERRRQHMNLVRALETRKRVEERERKRIELRAEKIARQERKLEQRRVELEILKELRRPIEDMELDDVKEFPELHRIPGLKLSGQAFADTLMVFEFLHNFGETLGFDMESLPTLNNLQGALLNDEENEEELLSIMTHLLVCAIEDPGIPNPARHITLLGQSLKQADITHTNISEILRIYLYANATGEVKALTGLNFERDREKKISEHHNLYGEEAQSQHCGKNAAFFEHLYENATYKLSEELKEKPFLALNPTTKSAILAFLCNELLQNKAVLRQIEGSLETVILSRRERWGLDQSIRKLRCLHDRQLRYNILTKDKDCVMGLNQQPVNVNYKEKTNDGVDSEVESGEESDHESECTQPEEEDQQNLNTDEINKRLEKLIKQQEGYLSSLRTSNQQIRAMCLGQDRFWRRYWCLPTCRSIFVEGMESAQPDEYMDMAHEMELTKLCEDEKEEEKPEKEKDKKEQGESDADENEEKSKTSGDTRDSKRRLRKRKGSKGHWRGKKTKFDEDSSTNNNSEEEMSENEEVDNSDSKKGGDISANETDVCNNNNNTNVNNNESNCTVNNNNSDSDNKSVDELSGDRSVVDNKDAVANNDTEKEIPSDVNGESHSIKQESDEGKANSSPEEKESEVAEKVVKMEVCEDESNKGQKGATVSDKEVNCTEENIKQELKPLEDVIKKEKDAKPVTQDLKEYLRQFGEPLKSYADHLDELTEKDFNGSFKDKKDFYIGKAYGDGDPSKRYKFEDEDPLLKAMKNELSTRIFGSPSGYLKKEELDDSHFLRNTGSPLANGEKFPGFDLLAGSYGLMRESDAECQWFSLLPKESCDPNTVFLGKNDSEKILLPMYLPTRGGLPPSPGPLPPCDSPAPLILSPEEAAMLEQIKVSGPKPPPVRKSVPQELRRGWWRITDEEQLYKILESLHGRGVRERELKRMLTRYLDNSLETGGKATMFKPVNDLVDLDHKEKDSRIKFLSDGAPMSDVPNSWDRSVLQRVENLLLEQVENLEDKVASASMQVKGWKIPSRSGPSDSEDGDSDNKSAVDIAKERLIALEAAIERRYLKPPLGFSTAEGGIGIQPDQDESIPKGLGVWREAVLKSHTAAQLSMALYMLESCIAWDKSIMKANCQFCQSGDNEDKLLLCDGCDRGYHMYCFKPKMDTIPDGDWYCHECKNKASGERNCIVCGKRPVKNFVLCEHCPRAYHADCLNPPLLKVPRSKWNCANCAIKFPKKKCGRKLGWRKNKDQKSKDDSKEQKDSGNDDKTNDSDADSDGEDLPLSSAVSSKDSKEKECAPLSPIPSASSLTSSNSALNDEPPPLSPQQPPASVSAKKERISKKVCKELNACKTLIEEMESQDEAWPFLLPVNTKQFPTYKKIIKCPMDISTIKKRLTDGVYKTKEEFVFDVRQIFNNCETFNEDDSPVGKAGHAMRSYFEARWGELMSQKSSP
ncbi:UNVERIFIED_CONTAM: hypothetical protein PYX00_010324 [Menopon gallinae]|uniref:Bromodomain adjacent to zinc finger domain protein 2B n=1 Tax=Menopon gallinae TaxID=328185 RepID=A0AAW2HF20_9NEOP